MDHFGDQDKPAAVDGPGIPVPRGWFCRSPARSLQLHFSKMGRASSNVSHVLTSADRKRMLGEPWLHVHSYGPIAFVNHGVIFQVSFLHRSGHVVQQIRPLTH